MTIDTHKMIESVHDYITELESFRPPIKRPITFYPFNVFSKRSKRSYFIQNNPKLHEKIRKELDPYFKKMVKVTFKEVIILFSGIFLFSFIIAVFLVIFTNELLREIFAGIMALIIAYFIFRVFDNHKHVAGEKYDEQIKNATQKLIDYAILLIKENDLDPTKYHFKLKHNDYQNLKYKIKNNYYVGYFEK